MFVDPRTTRGMPGVNYDVMSFVSVPSVRRLVTTVAVGAFAVGCAGSDEATSSSPGSSPATSSASSRLLPPDEFDAFLADNPDVPLINVHIPYERHIDGTEEFIPFDTITESADLPTDKSAPVAIYCRSGSMSAEAAADLTDAGYTNVIDLEGGMNAWSSTGHDLVDDATAVEN